MPVFKRLLWWVSAAVMVAAPACRQAPTPALPAVTPTVVPPARAPAPTVHVEPTAAPTVAPTAEPNLARRVVILSLDGARDDWVDQYLQDGTMPNLAALAVRGVRAEHAQTVDPSLTAAAHLSIATGAHPGVTGQVSNKFHLSKNAFYWYTSGFDEPEMQVEALWQVAKRQGLSTATLFWPGTTIQHVDRLSDYTVAYGTREVYSRLHTVKPQEAKGWKDAPPSHSPLLEAELPMLGSDDALVTRVYVLAADSTDDGQATYDAFHLCTKRQFDGSCAEIAVGGWAPLLVRPRLHSGGYFKLQDASAERVEVFQSALWYNEARPVELLRDINERFGFFPPTPDYYALEHGWISAEDYWFMVEIQMRWLAEVEAHVLETYQPDLTFAWLGATDECGHQFLLVGEDQPGYSPERSEEYQGYVRAAYALADESLAVVAGPLDLGADALFVLSDHGMAPIHSLVYVNTILHQAGLLYYGEGSSFPIDTGRSKAIAFASGGAVHLYVNLKGREQPGIVPPEEYESVQQQIVQALRDAKGRSGEPLFARVLRRDELHTVGLDSPNSGDVFAQAARGYALTDWRGNPDVVGPSDYYGQHGYDSRWPEMRAILIAAGAGLRAGTVLPAVHLLDVVPTVATAMGFVPAESMEGRVLLEALR